jgi:hypothetical protein
MSNTTTDPRIAEAYGLINGGAQPGTLSPRELAVIVLALAERAGANLPWDEDTNHNGSCASDLMNEADMVLDRLLARLTVGR